MDSGSLNELLDRSQEEEVLFLFYWLREQRTKAVIPKKGRDRFIATLETKAETSPDVYYPILSFFRGYTTPYRFKYANEAGIKLQTEEKTEEKMYSDDMDEKQIIIKVSNWHYATVKYVIVKNPEEYRRDNLITKLRQESITDIDGFYKLISAEDIECVRGFKDSIELHMND